MQNRKHRPPAAAWRTRFTPPARAPPRWPPGAGRACSGGKVSGACESAPPYPPSPAPVPRPPFLSLASIARLPRLQACESAPRPPSLSPLAFLPMRPAPSQGWPRARRAAWPAFTRPAACIATSRCFFQFVNRTKKIKHKQSSSISISIV